MINLCSEMWAKVCSSAFIQILSEFKISRFLEQKAVQCGDDLGRVHHPSTCGLNGLVTRFSAI